MKEVYIIASEQKIEIPYGVNKSFMGKVIVQVFVSAGEEIFTHRTERVYTFGSKFEAQKMKDSLHLDDEFQIQAVPVLEGGEK